MHFTTLIAVTTLAFTTSSHAVSSQFVFNNCTESIYITNVNSTKSTTGPFEVKGTGGNWTTEIIGVGNSLGISKTDRYWTPETPKFILGTSTDAGIVYWTVSNVDGDPFLNQTFELSSGPGNVCDNATT